MSKRKTKRSAESAEQSTGTAEQLERFSPDMLMRPFTRSPILLAIALAILVHVVVFAGASISGMISKWVNPTPQKPAATQPAESEPAQTQPETEPEPEPTTVEQPKTQPDDAIPEHVKNSAQYKRSTEVAKPDEIPSNPDGGLIDLDATN